MLKFGGDRNVRRNTLFQETRRKKILMKHTSMKPFSFAAVAFALTLPAMGANSLYAPGDLVLTFQKEGSINTVYANLGSAAGFRGTAAGADDGTNVLNILDLNSTLTSAFGSGWASDTSIYAGLAGVYSTNDSSNAITNGDPNRTLYVSASRDGVGTVGSANSSAYAVTTNSGMTAGANRILAQNNAFELNYDAAFTVSPTSVSLIDDQNPFLSTGIQGDAFGIFSGGIQQVGSASSFGTFGAAGNVEFALDLYRILAKTGINGQVAGVLREGSYEGTVTINSSGKVSFIAKGESTATPFESWIAGYTTITATADKASAADPDGDGLSNLTEFVLGGNPSVSNPSAGPAAVISGNNLAVSFTRSAASVGNTTAVVQYSTDLSTWSTTDVTTPTTSGAQTVNVPTSKASNGKLFTRLKVTQP